jgi:hypothetical protein
MALADLFPVAAGRETRIGVAWPALLLAAALLSSVTFACVTPFAAFAVLAAATMPLPRALAMVAGVWLVNQVLGFCALGYPFDGIALVWGAAIGVAALAGTAAAAAILARTRGWPLAAGMAAAFAAAFIAYQALLFLAALGLGGTENFTVDIVAKLAVSDTGWLVGIAIVRYGLLRLILSDGRRPVTT